MAEDTDDKDESLCPMCERRRPDEGFVLCLACQANLCEDLDEVTDRFGRLTPMPGRADTGSRGAPGFRSQPPGSVHVMSMRDPRSKEHALRDDWEVEERRPPRSVQAVLFGLAMRLRAARGLTYAPPRTVVELTVWLTRHVDWLSRDQLGYEAARAVRGLRNQLRCSTGEPSPSPIGHCIEEGCAAPIFMPPTVPRAPDEPIKDMPTLTCPRCRSQYDGRRLILLRLVEESAVA